MKKIILSLDEVQSVPEAVALVQKTRDKVYAFKVHNLYDQFGPEIVERLKIAGAKKVWVDFKLYDIPNTAKLRAKSLMADIITVHASGGVEMMKQAVASGKEVFAVTMLTSFTPLEVQEIYNRQVNEQVLILARMAKEAGVSGVVCSPQEVKMLSESTELKGLKFVVPGIRSAGKETNDQNRVGTPAEAVKNGATYLVIGRQITLAKDPVAALEEIEKELSVLETA